jgi:hypothetical protein
MQRFRSLRAHPGRAEFFWNPSFRHRVEGATMDRRILKSQVVRHRDRPGAISNRTGGANAQLDGVAVGPAH